MRMLCAYYWGRALKFNDQGGRYGSALNAAVKYGHETTVRLLTEYGAEVNSKDRLDGQFYTLLQDQATNRLYVYC